ncbi:hypothetical protein [Pseudooceanicola sp. LIPI14-2-Ac024]|uniref:hypothetical protein n=1 Tax=Pseudooceanicola sp. LIPI14-2-Ac024 TaxID=3344875 RepID=UPI0035D0D451
MSALIAAAVPLFFALMLPAWLAGRWPTLSGGRLCALAVAGALVIDAIWVLLIEMGVGRWLAALDHADPLGFALTVWAGLLAAPVLALARSLWIVWQRRQG